MNVRALADRLGARIVERRGGIAQDRWLISEYHTRHKTIVLYRDTLEVLADLVVARDLPFDVERLDEIAIAHECFHLLFPGTKGGGEERVHAFVQELLELPASPALLQRALAESSGELRA